MSGMVGLWRARPAVAPLPLSCSELCPGHDADAGSQVLGDVEVPASGLRTKGSLERVGPHVPRPAPRLQDFIAPTLARDAAEYRSALAPRQLPTLGIGCRSHNRSGEEGRGARQGRTRRRGMGKTLRSVGFVNLAGRPASSPFLHASFSRNHRVASSISPLSLAWAPAQLFPAPGCKAHQVGNYEAFLTAMLNAPCSSVPTMAELRSSMRPAV